MVPCGGHFHAIVLVSLVQRLVAGVDAVAAEPGGRREGLRRVAGRRPVRACADQHVQHCPQGQAGIRRQRCAPAEGHFRAGNFFEFREDEAGSFDLPLPRRLRGAWIRQQCAAGRRECRDQAPTACAQLQPHPVPPKLCPPRAASRLK